MDWGRAVPQKPKKAQKLKRVRHPSYSFEGAKKKLWRAVLKASSTLESLEHPELVFKALSSISTGVGVMARMEIDEVVRQLVKEKITVVLYVVGDHVSVEIFEKILDEVRRQKL